MKENETNEVLDTQLDEESNEESNEVEETEEELEESQGKTQEETDEDSTEDSDSELEKLRKENKTLMIQKDKWRKKAEKSVSTDKSVSNEINEKTDNASNNDSRVLELSRLAAKGYSDEDIDLLIDIKDTKNLKNLLEAEKSTIFQLSLKEKEEEERKKKASLGASGSGYKSKKPPTKTDLKKQWLGR